MEHVTTILADFIVNVLWAISVRSRNIIPRSCESFRMLGDRCQYSPMDCLRFKHANSSIKCVDPQLCVVNDTKKLDELKQLSTNTCQNERDQQLDAYFTCINEQPADRCTCPASKLKGLTS